MKVYGYVRVSTRDQNEDRQVVAMRAFGVADEDILVEKWSGKDFDRPIYQRLLKKIKPGDTLVVKSVDRLGRNYDEIRAQWQYVTKRRGADIVVIDMPLLDTRQKEYDLTTTFVVDMVLQMLGYVAESEMVFNRQRQSEGIAVAKARGVIFGKKPMERPPMFEELRGKWERGEVSSREAGKLLGVSHTTFLTWVGNK